MGGHYQSDILFTIAHGMLLVASVAMVTDFSANRRKLAYCIFIFPQLIERSQHECMR